MSKLDAFVRQFRIVWYDGRCYAERDGVLYSAEALARLAVSEGIAAPRKRVREVLYVEGARWENSADLEGRVVGPFPLAWAHDGQYGLFYIVEGGLLFVPVEGEPIMCGADRPYLVYRFAGAGEGRRLDFAGEEADFWAYWAAATSPLGWKAKASAAVFLPVLLGLASGGWVFVEGSWGAQAEVLSALIYLVWRRSPEPVGSALTTIGLWSDAHLDYIAETGLVGVYKVGGRRAKTLEGVASELRRAREGRHRVGMVCGAGPARSPSEAPSLLRVPLRRAMRRSVRVGGKRVSAKEALVLIQPKALMGAFRLFQRAAKAIPPAHPVTAFSDWGSWALRFGEVLGVREEVSAIFADYVRAAVADVSQLDALRQFFASPQFAVGRKYTLRDVVAIGRLSDAGAKELERAMRTANGQRLLGWVLGQWGVRFTIYPDTSTSPLYLSFHPLREERTAKTNGRHPHPKRKKGGKKPKRAAK